MTIPRALSAGEEEFADHCREYGLNPVREFRFHPTRRWRVDFGWPELKLAVEIEGVTASGGRHQRMGGFTQDCAKYNFAAEMGWRIFRFTPAMVHSGEAIDTVLRVMGIGQCLEK